MIRRHRSSAREWGGRFGFLLLACVLWLGAALPAQAEDCSSYPGGVLDGFAGTVAPSQLNIDRNCTVRNYPGGMSTNFSFNNPGGQNGQEWLVIFDNVVHTGSMSCNQVHDNKIWFVNGSFSRIHQGCQNLFIPVEKIDKQTPAGQTTATVGLPFTYTLTMPVLFDPLTGTVINAQGSLNDLHGITVTDDLDATGADLTYASHVAYWRGSGAPVPHTFSNVGDVLTFDNFPIVPAGEQITLELTVVLADVPANLPGTQFINTAKWDFGRLIDGVFYEPLPGEWGISPPLTIVGPPDLVFTKTGPAQMNLGTAGIFTFDVQNGGGTDAWDVTILDALPDGATGGMCDTTPTVLGARVFAADGVTPVSGPLVPGADFSLGYAGAPTCELTLTMITAAGVIGPSERLIVTYQTELDADSQDGATLTNVAGATQWFDADSSNASRHTYARTLTDGTVGTPDHEDAHTVTVALSGYFFEKTVANLTSGASPTTTANPGDRLRYTLRLQTTTQALTDVTIQDELDRLNDPAAFVAGTLQLVTVPTGADTSNTSSTGGAKGTGVLDIRDLSPPAASEIVIQFDITLASTLVDGTVVTNQSSLLVAGAPFAISDDPNVNGQADPLVAGDEDPTRVRIESGPDFRVEKVSDDITGDPNELLAGERLRYTITVKNVGTEDAVDTVLRDAVPANTTYVAGSTTLNGATVADGPGGTSPLVAGILIHAPEDPTPGAMRADASATTSNVATIVFDVIVDPGVADGTVISNQGFVSAPAGGVTDQPSDDPGTAVADDPTRDVVRNPALLFAPKTVALLVDLGAPGIVDPGDVLRYTITVQNNGTLAVTGVVLSDSVPANTTYVADSTTLNGLPVGQPDGGVSPLAAGIPISSSDLTPPLPGPAEGTLSPGQSAVLQFDLQVNLGVAAGTLISNQAVLRSDVAPDLLTDGDGNPATGPEPTVVVVGDVQQLSITKQVAVVGGGAALPGAQLEYVVNVVNNASVPAFGVVITDDLAATPGQLAYVDPSASLNGSANGISVAGSVIAAAYSTVYGPLQPGGSVVLRFRAVLASNLAAGTTVTNTGVVTWNTPQQTASASVSIDVGGLPGVGVLSGRAWHDADFDRVFGGTERPLEGWIVELYQNSALLLSVLTDASGTYRIEGVQPNDAGGVPYELRFRAPDAGANTASLGRANSAFTNGPQQISDIVVASGANLQDLDLPIDPNGVVYSALVRGPIPGAQLTLLAASGASPLPALCFDDPAQQGQVTRGDGFYKFDLNFSDAACPSGGSYLIAVVPPGAGFVTGYSQIIPPVSDASTAPFSVPTCAGGVGDAVPSTPQHCEVQPSELAPPPSVPPGTGTNYHVHLSLDSSQVPGSSQIFNNHIPLDPVLDGVIGITKTTPSKNVSRGQLVPYEITLRNGLGAPLGDVTLRDRFPAGFHYVEGSARIDGVPLEPTLSGRELTWTGLTVDPLGRRTLQLLLAVGGGVGEGEYVNRAQAFSTLSGAPLSGEATATVRVLPDPSFDCTDVMGKVFNDANRNGTQEGGEKGLQGVRLVTARGLTATTDQYGRFHITCAITPNENRGSNFVLKLDDRTLPSGYRLSTRRNQVQRATRGKALRFNYAASIHRVVALDMADAAFEPNSTEMREQWKPRIALLLDELKKSPATLRLSYVADVEDEQLVEERLNTIKEQITEAWEALECCYQLTIEPEVFWHRGAPANELAPADR